VGLDRGPASRDLGGRERGEERCGGPWELKGMGREISVIEKCVENSNSCIYRYSRNWASWASRLGLIYRGG